ncbi:MAG: hypothetical protein AAGF47_07795 [Planctomycetota bacterium]
MSKTDIMSHMELHVFAEMGLIIFLIAFLAVVLRVAFSKRTDNRAMAAMPLDDIEPVAVSEKEVGDGA